MKLKLIFNQYPLPLWALGLFLLCLGFSFRVDFPLAIFAFATIYGLSLQQDSHKKTFSTHNVIKEHWHVLIFLIVTFVVSLLSKDILVV